MNNEEIDYEQVISRLSYDIEKTVFENKFTKDQDLIFILDNMENVIFFQKLGYAAIAINLETKLKLKEYTKKNKNKIFVLVFNNNENGINLAKMVVDLFKDLDISKYKIALPEKYKTWGELIDNKQLNERDVECILNENEKSKDCLIKTTGFAKSESDYFEAYQKIFNTKEPLIFEFDNSTFKGVVKELKSENKLNIKRLMNCTITLDYSCTVEDKNDKHEYYLTLRSDKEYKKIKLNSNELQKLSEFENVLQHNRKTFYGTSNDLKYIRSYIFENDPPKVRSLSFIGYDDKTKWYFFPEFAFNEKGNLFTDDAGDYFRDVNTKPFMGRNDVIKCTDMSDFLCPPQYKDLPEPKSPEFLNLFYQTYGFNGLLALGFYISSLFSHIIFKHYNFFPFLSIYGDTNTGKSFISKFLNSLFFINSEGLSLLSTNTPLAELKEISQKSNLVWALLEGSKNSKFDYDSLLNLYHRHPLRLTSANKRDNTTEALLLKGTLSFVWNEECFKSIAAKERVISLYFSEKNKNTNTEQAWEILKKYPSHELSNFGYALLKNREFFEENLLKQIKNSAEQLRQRGINVARIAENYAIALGGINTFLDFKKLSVNLLLNYTVECAQSTLAGTKEDLSIANHFLELIDTHYYGVIYNNELVLNLEESLKSLQKSGHNFNRYKLIKQLQKHERYLGAGSTRAFGENRYTYRFKPIFP